MRVLFTPPRFGFVSGSSSYPRRGGLPLAHIDTLAQLGEEETFVSSNSGNILHVEAPARVIHCDRRYSVSGFVPVSNNQRAAERLISEAEANFDLVVLSFANIVRDFATLREVTREQLEAGFRGIREFLENSRIRVAAFGIGLQTGMAARAELVGPELYRMLQVMNDRCDIIGTRGERTAEFLQEIGIRRALPLGCPSVIVNPEGVVNPVMPQESRQIRVATAGRLTRAGGAGSRVQPLLDLSREFETDYVFQDDLHNLFRKEEWRAETPYNSETGEVDAAACRHALRRAKIEGADFRSFWYFREAPAWRGWAAAHDLYLGDRFHGGVAFLQAGRPAGFLHDDLRVSELTEHYGLPSFSMDEARQRGVKDLVAEILDPATRDRVRRTFSRRLDDFRDACAKAGIPLRDSVRVRTPDQGAAPAALALDTGVA